MLNKDDLEGLGYYDPDYNEWASENNLLGTYQNWVETMMLTEGKDRLIENTLGLVGEAGEVAEKIKKFIRDDSIDVSSVKKELGDVLFYLTALSTWFGITAEEVLKANMEKLNSRKERNKLQGNGDDR